MPDRATPTTCWFVPPAGTRSGWLLCRRLEPTDGDALFEAVASSREHLRPWMAWAAGYTLEMARAFAGQAAADGDGAVPEASYAICDRSGLVGVCGLHARIAPNALEIGYWVDVRHTRRKVATLAAATLTELALGVPGMAAVEIHHDQANTSSGAVPVRLGYEHVATVHRQPEAPGETGVEVQWRMTRAAWPASGGARLLADARDAPG